ncbi:GM16215 [Drosophila sechellia]|uniref:GM16215 n=1 Tax=Drosophila sechellia TaxID=7238 RepID=B4IPH4_DROSE|nr:GM16215 [Drosophila sechellia]
MLPYQLDYVRSTYSGDCAGLTSINHISKILCALIGHWCFTKELGSDFTNLFQGSERLDFQSSYFPSQVDFLLISKSAYSATVNQMMYFFVHAVGSLMGSTRSANAMFFLDSSIQQTTHMAIWIALIHYTAGTYTRVFGDIDEVSRAGGLLLEDEDDIESPDVQPRPLDLDPKGWYDYLADNQFKFTESDVEKFERMKKNMGTEFREGSIGSYISSFTIGAN